MLRIDRSAEVICTRISRLGPAQRHMNLVKNSQLLKKFSQRLHCTLSLTKLASLKVHVSLSRTRNDPLTLQVKATSKFTYTRLGARDHCTSSTLIGGKGGAGPSSLHAMLERQGTCKVYMDSYMASNGSCIMVTWTIFKTHLLEVGGTQNQEIMALCNLIVVDFVYIIMCDDHA